MREGSLIDDVFIELYGGGNGSPIRFQNQDIRKMLNLVKANENDVIYDLGCGFGQNLILAASEFGVSECVGIDYDGDRADYAKRRIDKWVDANRISKGQVKIVEGQTKDAIKGDLRGANLKRATIILFLLQDEDILKWLKKANLPSRGCRFVYYDLCLYPEIFPTDSDYPFYYSTAPFQWTKGIRDRELRWLRKVIEKKHPKLSKSDERQELWDELWHDHNVQGESKEQLEETERDYKRKLGVKS